MMKKWKIMENQLEIKVRLKLEFPWENYGNSSRVKMKQSQS